MGSPGNYVGKEIGAYRPGGSKCTIRIDTQEDCFPLQIYNGYDIKSSDDLVVIVAGSDGSFSSQFTRQLIWRELWALNELGEEAYASGFSHFGDEKEQPFIVLRKATVGSERGNKNTLDERTTWKQTPTEILHIARSIYHELRRYERAGIIHRNICAENVVLVDGEYKFSSPTGAWYQGTCDLNPGEMKMNGFRYGDLRDMSPEQIVVGKYVDDVPPDLTDAHLTSSCDRYAAALLLYHLATSWYPHRDLNFIDLESHLKSTVGRDFHPFVERLDGENQFPQSFVSLIDDTLTQLDRPSLDEWDRVLTECGV